MHIITPQDADQIIQRKPWPIYSTFPHCSGPCKQGRSPCMTPEACETGQHTDDDRPAMTRSDALLSLALMFACWGVVVAVMMAFGVRL